MKPSSPTMHFEDLFIPAQPEQNHTIASSHQRPKAPQANLHGGFFHFQKSLPQKKGGETIVPTPTESTPLRGLLASLSAVVVWTPVRGPRGGKKRFCEDENSPKKVVKKTKIVAASFDEKIDVDGDAEMAKAERFSIIDPKGSMKM